MKKLKKIYLLSILLFIMCFIIKDINIFANQKDNFGKILVEFQEEQSQLADSEIINKIKSSAVMGKIIAIASKHTSYYNESGRTGVYEVGDEVEILQDRGAKWYRVKKLGDQESWWIKAETISIPEDEPSDKSRMTNEELEKYANIMKFESKSNYFVFTDISRQLTYIYTGKCGDWKLLRTMICATGKNVSPTTRGNFIISQRGNQFYSQRLSSGARYWVRFNDTYLYHSVAMDKKQKVVDGVLGEKRSMGCIRLSVDDAKWFYDTIPEGTGVFIF